LSFSMPYSFPYINPASFRWSFITWLVFTVMGRQPLAQPPTWRTRVSRLVWIITFDLSVLGGPTGSYATAGIALRIIWPRKPRHYDKVEIPEARSVDSATSFFTCVSFF
jgi:hypothetical protein